MTVFCSCVCVWDGPWKDDRTKYLPNNKGQLSADNTCDFKRSNPTWFFLLFIFCFPPKIMTTVNIHDSVFSLSGSPTSHYSCNHVLHPNATSNFFFQKPQSAPFQVLSYHLCAHIFTSCHTPHSIDFILLYLFIFTVAFRLFILSRFFDVSSYHWLRKSSVSRQRSSQFSLLSSSSRFNSRSTLYCVPY